MSQTEHSQANHRAWSHRAYEAWHRLGGTPEEAAAKIRENPEYTLRDYLGHLGDLKDKTVANLLGSHGKKAVAMTLLGAQVTVVDFTEDNRRYALEFAQAAGVSIDYILTDVLEWDAASFEAHFDLVLMEYGILHYFVDLNPLTKVIQTILKSGGKVVLHEYHPMFRKFTPRKEADQIRLEGDYFAEGVAVKTVPYHMAFSKEEVDTFPSAHYRYWQMGEIVTAFGAQDMVVERLEEKPHRDLPRLPGMFTLVARKL